jgi:predicted DNA-binding transcriptional regulator AlpA
MAPDETPLLLLRYEDLASLGIHLSRAQIYRMMDKGTFPKTVKVSECRVAWKKEEVLAWIEKLK